MLSKRALLLLNALLWSVAGLNVLRRGLPALLSCLRLPILLPALAVALAFLLLFRRVSAAYSRRIIGLRGERFPFFRFMSGRGYLVIGLMMTMGIVFSRIPGLPEAFFALLYPGLGLGLSYGAIRFAVNSFKIF